MKQPPQNELLSAYLDGELSAQQRARVEQWLAEDATAQQRLDGLRAVGASLKGLPAHRLDEDLSERVLRAAEHRILAEPTRLAEVGRPAAPAKRLSAGRLARRFLTPRAIAWSGLAVAVAILLSVFPFGSLESERDVARGTKEWTPDDTPLALVAIPEASEAPAAAESATTYEQGTLKRDGHFKTAKSDGRAAPPLAAEGVVAKSRTGREPAPAAAKGKAGSVPMERHAGVGGARGEGGQTIRKGGSRSRALLAGTAVRRAVRNQPGLLVVNCALTPTALRKKAFTKTLVLNDIDVVAVPADEKHLAAHLVTNFARVSPDTFKEAVDRFDRNRDRLRKDSKEPASKRLADAGKGETVRRKLAFAAGELDDEVLALPAGSEVEVVLVEGSPRQIAATLVTLRRQKDMVVSIPAQPANQYRYGRQQQIAEESLNADFRESIASRPDAARVEPEQTVEKKTVDAPRRYARQEQTQHEGLRRQVTGHVSRRGTAQRLGTIALSDETSIDKRPPRSAQEPALSPRPSHTQPGERGLAEKENLANQKQQTADDMRRTGMGGLGGAGMGGADSRGFGKKQGGLGTRDRGSEKKSEAGSGLLGQKRTPAYRKKTVTDAPNALPSSTSRVESEKQTRPSKDRRGRITQSREAVDAESQPLRLQVLFVLQRIPNGEPPAAASGIIESKAKPKREPATPAK